MTLNTKMTAVMQLSIVKMTTNGYVYNTIYENKSDNDNKHVSARSRGRW